MGRYVGKAFCTGSSNNFLDMTTISKMKTTGTVSNILDEWTDTPVVAPNPYTPTSVSLSPLTPPPEVDLPSTATVKIPSALNPFSAGPVTIKLVSFVVIATVDSGAI